MQILATAFADRSHSNEDWWGCLSLYADLKIVSSIVGCSRSRDSDKRDNHFSHLQKPSRNSSFFVVRISNYTFNLHSLFLNQWIDSISTKKWKLKTKVILLKAYVFVWYFWFWFILLVNKETGAAAVPLGWGILEVLKKPLNPRSREPWKPGVCITWRLTTFCLKVMKSKVLRIVIWKNSTNYFHLRMRMRLWIGWKLANFQR